MQTERCCSNEMRFRCRCSKSRNPAGTAVRAARRPGCVSDSGPPDPWLLLYHGWPISIYDTGVRMQTERSCCSEMRFVGRRGIPPERRSGPPGRAAFRIRGPQRPGYFSDGPPGRRAGAPPPTPITQWVIWYIGVGGKGGRSPPPSTGYLRAPPRASLPSRCRGGSPGWFRCRSDGWLSDRLGWIR